jgi:glycosyltransferase involved in cell wall biosynthesis
VPFEAVLAGPDDDAAAVIRTRIADAGLQEHIRLTGQLSQAELLEEYRRASALCLPCRVLDNGDRDGIPNVLAEAMACGTPVVTTAVSGIPELVRDDVNGLLVAPDDPAAVADAIQRVHGDRELSARLSDGARATIRDAFDGDQLTGTLARLFREALA